MALIDVLSIDGDTEAVKTAINTAMVTLTASATQLALVALKKSDMVLESAFNSEPVIGSFDAIADCRKFSALSRQAIESAETMQQFLCAANESLDDEVNAAYSAYLTSLVDTAPIAAILEEGERKIALAFQSLPTTLLHASRFDGSVFIPKENGDGT